MGAQVRSARLGDGGIAPSRSQHGIVSKYHSGGLSTAASSNKIDTAGFDKMSVPLPPESLKHGAGDKCSGNYVRTRERLDIGGVKLPSG